MPPLFIILIKNNFPRLISARIMYKNTINAKVFISVMEQIRNWCHIAINNKV